MKFEHVNLVVSNIADSLKFYKAAFPHWQIRCEGKDDWYGKPRNWLHFGDEYLYLAFSDHGIGDNRDLKGHQVGLAHFAFVVNNLQAVITRLESSGFSIHQYNDDYSYRKNAYFIDPDGFEIEFVEYSSDVPSKRNSELN